MHFVPILASGKKKLNPHNCPNWKEFLIHFTAVCLFLVSVQKAWSLPLCLLKQHSNFVPEQLGFTALRNLHTEAQVTSRGTGSSFRACSQLPLRPRLFCHTGIPLSPHFHSPSCLFPHRVALSCCLHTLSAGKGTERLCCQTLIGESTTAPGVVHIPRATPASKELLWVKNVPVKDKEIRL